MKVLGMAEGSTDLHVGLCSPSSVLYKVGYRPFPARLIWKAWIKPLSTPSPPWAWYCYSPVHPWGAVAAVAAVTIRAQQPLAPALWPSSQLLPALPAQGKVCPPIPIPSLCFCLWIHGALFFLFVFPLQTFQDFSAKQWLLLVTKCISASVQIIVEMIL